MNQEKQSHDDITPLRSKGDYTNTNTNVDYQKVTMNQSNVDIAIGSKSVVSATRTNEDNGENLSENIKTEVIIKSENTNICHSDSNFIANQPNTIPK